MNRTEILREIELLSLDEKLILLQKIISDMTRHYHNQQLSVAAEMMENEYKSNPELTAFSSFT